MSNIVMLYEYSETDNGTDIKKSSMKVGGWISRGLATHRGPKNCGLWKNSIVVFNYEYSFGKIGITISEPGAIREQTCTKRLGITNRRHDELNSHIRSLRSSDYRKSEYHPENKNCKIFANDICTYLLGMEIMECLNL